MVGGVVQVSLWFYLPETYPPRLLTLKARKLREEKSDSKYRSPFEIEALTSKGRATSIIEYVTFETSPQRVKQR